MPKMNIAAENIPFYLTKAISEGVAKEPGVINLSRGQAGFLPPQEIYNEAQGIISRKDKSLFKYKPAVGDQVLRQAIANWYGQEYNLNIDPNTIAVTVGGTGAISLAFQTLTNPGDLVIVPDPSYPFYAVASETGLDFSREVLRTPIGMGKLTEENLKNIYTDKGRAPNFAMITSPHNPTGVIYDQKTLQGLVNFAKEHDAWIVCDDNHFPEVYDGKKHVPIRSIDTEGTHTVMLGSLSRLALQGERVGWAVLPDAKTAELYAKQNPFPSTRAQMLATFVLNHYQELPFNQEFEAYEAKRNMLVPKLDALPGFSCDMPEGTSYVFPNISEFANTHHNELVADVTTSLKNRDTPQDTINFVVQHPSTLVFNHLLYAVGVGTVPGITYGPASDDHIRLTFSVPKDQLEEAINRMEKYLG